MKALFFSLLVSISLSSFSQESKPTSGLLLLSLNRTESAFDLFYPCRIDSTRSLKENILQSKSAGAWLANLNNEEAETLLAYADTLKNESLASKITDDLEYIMVIPVSITLSETKPVFAKNTRDFYLDWPVKFFNKTLFESYNAKQMVIESVRVIRLRD